MQDASGSLSNCIKLRNSLRECIKQWQRMGGLFSCCRRWMQRTVENNTQIPESPPSWAWGQMNWKKHTPSKHSCSSIKNKSRKKHCWLYSKCTACGLTLRKLLLFTYLQIYALSIYSPRLSKSVSFRWARPSFVSSELPVEWQPLEQGPYSQTSNINIPLEWVFETYAYNFSQYFKGHTPGTILRAYIEGTPQSNGFQAF